MNIVDEHTFNTTIANWQVIPFRQQKGWYTAQSRHYKLLFIVDEMIASVAYLKRRYGITMLVLETPCKRTINVAQKALKNWYEQLYALPYDIIEYNSSEPYNVYEEIALRQAGWLRPVGLFSYYLTNIINLQEPIHYNENWRRNLKHCADAHLQLQECTDRQKGEQELWKLYHDMCQHKNLSLFPDRQFFHDILTDTHFRLFFAVSKQNESPVAMLLIHTSGTHAGLLYAANNEQGYAASAGFFVYDSTFRLLQQQGFCTFDMEKLGVGISSANAVATFKQGITGQRTLLLGEWARYRRHWMRIVMYFLKKYIWHRPET